MPDSQLPATRHRYEVYGLVINSELQFSSIEEAGEPAAQAPAAIWITLEDASFFKAKIGPGPFASDGWVRHALLSDGSFYLRAGDVFEAIVASDGRHTRCRAIGNTDLGSFEANLLNFVLSAALTLQGEEPMHSTVVDIGGKAVGLLGPSGAGKSTLAASLIGHGGELVTDDMLRVTFVDDMAIAHAGPYRIKLFDEPARLLLPRAVARGQFNAASGKVMIQPRRLEKRLPRRAWPLVALFWLGDDSATANEDVSSKQLAGTELAKILFRSAMNLRYQAIDRLARQVAFAERLAGRVPVHGLRYPRTFAASDRVIDEIHRLVAS